MDGDKELRLIVRAISDDVQTVALTN